MNSSKGEEGGISMGKIRICTLLVEDNSDHVRLIQELFHERNSQPFRLEIADSLEAACRRLSKGGIDVILLDLGLPDSQGMDSLRELRPPLTTMITNLFRIVKFYSRHLD